MGQTFPAFGRYTELDVVYRYGGGKIVAVKYFTQYFDDAGFHPGFTIHFDVKDSNNEEKGSAVIEIFNISQVKHFQVESSIVLRSGYKNSLFDVVFLGTLQEFDYEKDGSDIHAKLKCVDNSNVFLKGGFSKTYGIGRLWTSIAKDLVEHTGVPIGYIKWNDISVSHQIREGHIIPTNFSSYTVTPDKSIESCLREIAGYINYQFFMRHGRVYMMPSNYVIPEGFTLTSATGLISVQKAEADDSDYEYKIKSVLIPNIASNSLILVQSQKLESSQYMQVLKFNQHSSESEHYTEMECKVMTLAEIEKINIGRPTPIPVYI